MRAAHGLSFAVAVLAASAVHAEDIVAALGNTRIAIRSNFNGAALSVFGVVEREAGAPPRAGAYDAVVTVRGPRGAVSVWEKRQLGPFWFNLDQRKYIAIPSFISVQSNRAIEAIAGPEQRDEFHIGVGALIPEQISARNADDPGFREALQRIRRDEGLFRDDAAGVRFLTTTVFQSRVEIPGRAPLGAYDVDVALFADGARLARKGLNFSVTKSGVEQKITDIAHEDPTLYGVATSLMALFVGWLASIVFKRD